MTDHSRAKRDDGHINASPSLADLARTDSLIDDLSSGYKNAEFLEDPTVRALLSWREDIISYPMPPMDSVFRATQNSSYIHGVEHDSVPASSVDATQVVTALDTFREQKSQSRRGVSLRRRLLQGLTGVAVAAVLALGGMTIAVYSAGPGDPLWFVNDKVFPEQARVHLVAHINEQIDEAEELVVKGRVEEAEEILESARQSISNVSEAQEREQLRQRCDEIRQHSSQVSKSLVEPPHSTKPKEPKEPVAPTTKPSEPSPLDSEAPADTPTDSSEPSTEPSEPSTEPSGPSTEPPEPASSTSGSDPEAPTMVPSNTPVPPHP